MSKKDKDGFVLSTARRIPDEKRKKLADAARKKLGRPLKSEEEKYRAISIKIPPKVYDWAKAKSERDGVGYQTIINEVLLKEASKKKKA